MKFPCSHCGSDLSMQDRVEGEIKPIVPLEIQGNFAEPPPPEYVDSLPASTPSPSISPSKASSGPIYKGESKPRSTPPSSTSSSGTQSSSNTDYRLTSIEGTLDEITSQLTTLMKSQKVIETILTKINSELLKLRGK
jgi:hypothetical protein